MTDERTPVSQNGQPSDPERRQPPENGSRPLAHLAAVSGAHDATSSGAETAGGAEQRRKGPRAARRLAAKLRAGRDLSPDKLLLLDLTARMAVHAQNLSLRLFRDGETRLDGESKAAIAKLLELERAVRDGLRSIFGDDAGDDDPLSALLRGGR